MAFRASTTAVATARRFGTDARAGVAIIFAVSLPVVTIALGGAVDLARAHAARQTLSEVASLACQFASLPGVVGVGDFAGGVNAAGQTAYRTKVNDFIARTLRMQRFEYPQTTDDPFTFVPHGQAESTSPRACRPLSWRSPAFRSYRWTPRSIASISRRPARTVARRLRA